jgi:DNA-directed RNA polymerase subunit RPC12/RpoP
VGILGKFFGGKKKETEKKGIVCPYCGADQNSENWYFSDKKNISRWLRRARCIKCGADYWIVGNYEKPVGSQKIGM